MRNPPILITHGRQAPIPKSIAIRWRIRDLASTIRHTSLSNRAENFIDPHRLQGWVMLAESLADDFLLLLRILTKTFAKVIKYFICLQHAKIARIKNSYADVDMF